MAKKTIQEGFKPSILDRLLDPESRGTEPKPGYSFKQLLDLIRRDLENLLNTRTVIAGPRGLQTSIHCYGLPELTYHDINNPDQREHLRQVFQEAINIFEPRLRHVEVMLNQNPESTDQVIKFQITGQLAVEPFDDVMFQTILELSSGHYRVEN